MKAARQTTVEATEKAPIQLESFAFPPLSPLPQLHLYCFLFSRELDVRGVHVAKDGKQQLICHIL